MTAPSDAPRVAVLILTWNREDELVPCLESFVYNDYPNTTVVVIDNGSEDGSPETVKRDYSWVTLIENGANLGFCRGNNVGLRHALEQGFDYVMLLNSDTLMTPGLIGELVGVMHLAHDAGGEGDEIARGKAVGAAARVRRNRAHRSRRDDVGSGGRHQQAFRQPAQLALLGDPY